MEWNLGRKTFCRDHKYRVLKLDHHQILSHSVPSMFRGTHTCMGAHMCAPMHVCVPRNMNGTHARAFDENAKKIIILSEILR